MIAPERGTVHGRLKNSHVFTEKGLRPSSSVGRPRQRGLAEVALHLGVTKKQSSSLLCVLWLRFWGHTNSFLQHPTSQTLSRGSE